MIGVTWHQKRLLESAFGFLLYFGVLFVRQAREVREDLGGGGGGRGGSGGQEDEDFNMDL